MKFPKLSELNLAEWLVLLSVVFVALIFILSVFLTRTWLFQDLYGMAKIYLVIVGSAYTIGKLDLLKIRK